MHMSKMWCLIGILKSNQVYNTTIKGGYNNNVWEILHKHIQIAHIITFF